MPVIARAHSAKYDISKNELFTIKKITGESIIITDEERTMEIPRKDDLFQWLFYPAFCIVVHKSQGSTFNYEYSIHEFEKFDCRLKYVALSRSTSIENINIC